MIKVLDSNRRIDLIWGIKPTFLRYVLSIPDLFMEARSGAEWFVDGRVWRFPGVVTMIDGNPWDGGSSRVDFGGEVRLTGHGGALDVRLARLRVELGGGQATLSVANTGCDDDSSRLVVGTVVLNPSRRRGDGSAALDLDLHADAVDVFNGVYPVGTPLAPAILLPASQI